MHGEFWVDVGAGTEPAVLGLFGRGTSIRLLRSVYNTMTDVGLIARRCEGNIFVRTAVFVPSFYETSVAPTAARCPSSPTSLDNVLEGTALFVHPPFPL